MNDNDPIRRVPVVSTDQGADPPGPRGVDLAPHGLVAAGLPALGAQDLTSMGGAAQ